MTKRSVTHATFVIERVYDAEPARVFAALSDPAEKPRWLHGTAEILDALGAFLGGEKTGRALPTAAEGS